MPPCRFHSPESYGVDGRRRLAFRGPSAEAARHGHQAAGPSHHCQRLPRQPRPQTDSPNCRPTPLVQLGSFRSSIITVLPISTKNLKRVPKAAIRSRNLAGTVFEVPYFPGILGMCQNTGDQSWHWLKPNQGRLSKRRKPFWTPHPVRPGGADGKDENGCCHAPSGKELQLESRRHVSTSVYGQVSQCARVMVFFVQNDRVLGDTCKMVGQKSRHVHDGSSFFLLCGVEGRILQHTFVLLRPCLPSFFSA